MRNSSSISIICFGDSLTAGYQSPTHAVPYVQETPYGTFLQERLGAQAIVRTSGVCGEMTHEMVLRFREDVLSHGPDYVVILGGANDLGCHVAPPDIFSHLLHMYERSLATGIHPIAVTVPSIRMEINPADRFWLEEFVRQRQHLNRLIRQYCAEHAVRCVDLFGATVEPNTLLLARPYSNDGLHLTTEGYRKMADLAYDEISHARVREHHNKSE